MLNTHQKPPFVIEVLRLVTNETIVATAAVAIVDFRRRLIGPLCLTQNSFLWIMNVGSHFVQLDVMHCWQLSVMHSHWLRISREYFEHSLHTFAEEHEMQFVI